MNLLIVEPSKLFQHMLSSMFREWVTELKVVETGQAGLALLGRQQFDLICIARKLADMSGLDFARELRESSSGNYTPLVMVCAERDPELVKAALISGVTEVFHKSRLEELRVYIEELKERLNDDVYLQGRVLLVEDSVTMAAMLRHSLEEMGLEVDHETTAEQALMRFHERHYQLIVTDVVLAGDMSGIGLTRMVRHSVGKKSRVPILAISGLDDIARVLELLRSGANDYVAKPLVDEEFRARVKNLVLNQQLVDLADKQQSRLQHLALTDPLTGLYNRHFLVEKLPGLLSSAVRHDYDISLMLVDLDHFKMINDSHGHAAGDRVLVETAELLRAQVREEDIVARIGGEEFILVLERCTLTQACRKAEHLRKQLAQLRPVGIEVSASFGVASLKASGCDNYEELFQAADRAVYQAKSAGRNRVCCQ